MDMKFKLYVLMDKVAKQCGPVMEYVNDDVCVRAIVRNVEAKVGTYLSDFELYCIGERDPSEPMCDMYSRPEVVEAYEAAIQKEMEESVEAEQKWFNGGVGSGKTVQ